jgi:internalin A
MRYKTIIFVLALLHYGAEQATGDEAEDRLTSTIEKLGGTIGRDETKPGKPVTAVSFDFNNKKVSDDFLKELNGLLSLKSLSIPCDQISDVGMKYIKEMTTLEMLDIQSKLITERGVADLRDLRKLKSLRLDYCASMTDKIAETLIELTELEELTLPATITNMGIKKLAGLKKLKRLSLGGQDIGDDAVKDISEIFPDLESLSVSGVILRTRNEVTDEAVPYLKNLKKLKQLRLVGTQVTDSGLKDLAQMQGLEKLSLLFAKMTDEGVAEFRKINPQCAIFSLALSRVDRK